jgi:electron transfer flavoprotein alpha subunit
MSNVLVVAEVKGSEPKKVSYELLTLAKSMAGDLGGAVSALVIGNDLGSVADKLAAYGAAKVYVADGVDKYNTEGFAKIVNDVVGQESPGVVLFGATSMGRDLAPRLAARIDAGFVADCIEAKVVDGKVQATHPMFAGNGFATIAFNTAPAVISIRPNIIAVADAGAGAAETVSASADFGDVKAQVVEEIAGESARPDLTEADRIISGGRAMKSKENFKILEDMADVIGASVGASRAAVDAGYADQSIQVGQTGKTVNPSLYMAFGISGAIQHMAGMRTSKVIVAVNKDPEAPIFQKADYGIVADLFEVAPVMMEELKKVVAEG